MSSKLAEGTFQHAKERHLDKIQHLRKQQKKTVRLEPEYLSDKSQWLVNLSSARLNEDEEEVLRVGPKFAPSPKKIPYTDIIAGVEAATHKAKLPKEVSEEITSQVWAALQCTPKQKKNLVHELFSD